MNGDQEQGIEPESGLRQGTGGEPEGAAEPEAGSGQAMAGDSGAGAEAVLAAEPAPDREIGRLLELLEGAIRRSGRSRREIERSLGLGTGYLTHLFAGRMELKVRHISMLARELGFDAPTLFQQAYSDSPIEAGPAVQVRRGGGMTEEEVRRLIREELARAGAG